MTASTRIKELSNWTLSEVAQFYYMHATHMRDIYRYDSPRFDEMVNGYSHVQSRRKNAIQYAIAYSKVQYSMNIALRESLKILGATLLFTVAVASAVILF